MQLKIERLISAMTEFEGWKSAGSAESAEGSISYQNHNPLNLKASPFACGQNKGHAVFKNDEIGRIAAHWDIMQKARGNTSTGLTGESTIADLIKVWIEPDDPVTIENYLTHIEKNAGISRSSRLHELFD